jgi:DNA-binding MarR family transcriptional regulator
MSQLPIDFNVDYSARSRRADPQTSKDAAARVDAKGLALLVLESLRRDGPATSHELAHRLDIDLVSISPRMKPLEDAGRIERDGKRENRTVWKARP